MFNMLTNFVWLPPNQKEIEQPKISKFFQNPPIIRWLHTKSKANFWLTHSFEWNTNHFTDVCILKADARLYFNESLEHIFYANLCQYF